MPWHVTGKNAAVMVKRRTQLRYISEAQAQRRVGVRACAPVLRDVGLRQSVVRATLSCIFIQSYKPAISLGSS